MTYAGLCPHLEGDAICTFCLALIGQNSTPPRGQVLGRGPSGQIQRLLGEAEEGERGIGQIETMAAEGERTVGKREGGDVAGEIRITPPARGFLHSAGG